MDNFHVVALALIQGLTEFLPISSSAHLILPAQIFGWEDQGLAFDVAVHIGSLLAVILYFRHEIRVILTAWWQSIFKGKHSDMSRFAWWIIIATIPAVIFGFIFKDAVETYLRDPKIIAVSTVVFGLFLWWADSIAKCTQNEYQIGWKKALLIGLAQAIALIPGTSRSGITITAALALGLNREAAARFSFLMSIPIILGAAILMSKELVQTGHIIDYPALTLGVGISFASAYLCIHLFLKIISKMGMIPFVIYRLALGVLLCLFIFSQ